MTVIDDNYTGHVEPRTGARRTLPGASIVKVSVGPMDNNAYLVTCSQTGETLLIDAANDAEILLELIERYAPKLSLIVTSHQHQDHWLALDGADEATHLFTGDCLFPGGVGKTWKRGDFTQLLTDVASRVFNVYPDSTVVYPGHGDDTTLGAERPHLGEWRERGW